MCTGLEIGLLSAGASLIGGLSKSSAAKSAAKTQAGAANNAIKSQMQMFNQALARLDPYGKLGMDASGQLMDLLNNGNPFNDSSARDFSPYTANGFNYDQFPGYKFALDEGLKATQSGYAAKGLGNSGAALKGAGAFASGLADQTYKTFLQQREMEAGVDTSRMGIATQRFGFDIEQERLRQQQEQMKLQLLQNLVGIGGNAAGAAAAGAQGFGNSISESITGAGDATAAGKLAAGSAVGNIPGDALKWMYLLNGGGFGGGGGVTPLNIGQPDVNGLYKALGF